MRAVSVVAIVMALIIVLLKSGVVNALMMFLMVGAIPSTGLVFSPSTMLALVIIVGWLALIQLTATLIKIIRKQRRYYLSTYQHSPAVRRSTSTRRKQVA